MSIAVLSVRPAGVVLWGLLLMLLGCGEVERSSGAEEDTRQSAFRIRSAVDAGLNADRGWAAAVNTPATVEADRPFRLRFEVSRPVRAGQRFQLQARRNGGDWEAVGAENFPQTAKVLELDYREAPAERAASQWHWLQGGEASMQWRDDGGEGRLHVRGEAFGMGRYDTPWSPIEFAVEVRLPDAAADGAGLVFGYEDPDHYYRLAMTAGESLRVIRVAGGERTTLAEHEAPVKAGQWFELKLIMDGPDLIVEYDDEAVVFTESLGETIPDSAVGFYVPDGGTAEFRAFAIEGKPRTPRTSLIASDSWAHGQPTEDRLAGSDRPFTGGAGVSFADTTPAWKADKGQSEWEFPLVIRRFADQAAMNRAGDRFEYRLVDTEGRPLETDAVASVTLAVPDGHLGGTFVETPGRIGPWEASNGDLYFLMEPAETDNRLMTVKSDDGGKRWREVDGNNRPATGDLEGFASTQTEGRIHMLHQTSDDVWYHVFRTSDHPERPDTWAIRDERLASPEEPPTQVADIAVRSDGSVVGVYGGPEKIHYRIRSPEGNWSEETIIDDDRAPNLSGPSLVRDDEDVVHLTYTGDDGTAWYRRLMPDGELTERLELSDELGTGSEDVASILPLVYRAGSQTVSVIYRLASGILEERRVHRDGSVSEPVTVSDRAVVQNAVDADQTGADAIAHDDSVRLLFIERDSGQLFHTHRTGDGDWSEAERVQSETRNQWVRGALLKQTGEGAVYGYVYDAGADGGSGMNRYDEVRLESR